MTSVDEAAKRLRDAYSGSGIPPLRDAVDPLDSKRAYAIQTLNTEFWQSNGRKIVGRKIGLTAAAVQRQLGVDRPDYGVLFDDMKVADNGILSSSRVIQPKVEAEVALIMRDDLFSASATSADVLAAAGSAMAALEIVDSRIADWKITFADTVADNGSSAFFVLSEEAKPLSGLDLFSCGMVLEVDGVVASVGVGAACLGHPLNAAAWLARTLAEQGEGLRAGDVVLTGALGPMVALSSGCHVKATLGGLGSVSFRFEGSK